MSNTYPQTYFTSLDEFVTWTYYFKFVTWSVYLFDFVADTTGIMHETDDAYSTWSSWWCCPPIWFLTRACNNQQLEYGFLQFYCYLVDLTNSYLFCGRQMDNYTKKAASLLWNLLPWSFAALPFNLKSKRHQIMMLWNLWVRKESRLKVQRDPKSEQLWQIIQYTNYFVLSVFYEHSQKIFRYSGYFENGHCKICWAQEQFF